MERRIKTAITYLLIVLTFVFIKSVKAQDKDHAISIGIDPAVAIYGGHLDIKGIDFTVKYTYRTNDYDSWSNDEVGLFYERFEKINFENYGVFFNKIMFPKMRYTEIAFGIEASVIHRWLDIVKPFQDKDTYFWSYGLNGEFRYDINDYWRIGIQGNLKRRTDIEKWKYSNYILIAYKF